MPHILIIDDVPHILRWLVHNLKQDGHQVSTYAGGMVAAFRQIEKLRPDLIVIGYVRLDECSGLELLYMVRNTPEMAHLPVILMAHKNSWYNVMPFLESFTVKPDAYLINPCHPNEGPEIVSQLLSRSEIIKPPGG